MKHNTDAALEALALQVEQAFPGKTLAISTGRRMNIGFVEKTHSHGDIVRFVAGIEEGKKGDGLYWSPFVWADGRRLSDNARRADLLVLDSDKGHTRFDIEDALRNAGLAGLVVPSSSSGGRSMSDIEVSAFEAWQAAVRELEGEGADTRIARMIEMEGRLVPAIARTAREVGRIKKRKEERTPKGTTYREVEYLDIAHDPCPKYRIVLFLAKRWDATEYPSQGDAGDAWYRAYLAAVDKLGLLLDEMTTDTARLFYLTRVPGAKLEDLRRDRSFVPGRLLDIAELDAPTFPRREFPQLRKSPGKPVTGDRQTNYDGLWTGADGTTLDLKAWSAKYRERFLLRKALEDRGRVLLDKREDSGPRLHIICPFEWTHKATGGATFVQDAGAGRKSGRTSRGFVVYCAHNTCSGARPKGYRCEPASMTGGRDTLEYIAEFLDRGDLDPADLFDSKFLIPEFPAVEPPAGAAAPSASETPSPGAATAKSLFDGIEPFDLFAGDGIAGKPDLPAGLLPGVIEDFARDVAGRIGVEAGMPAAACLAAIAGALHDGFVIQPWQLNTEWTESARLWITVVADPGIGKTPSLEPALKALRAVEQRWGKEDGKKRAAYEIELKAHERRIKAGVEKSIEIKPGDDTSALWVGVEAPVEPEFRRVFVDDLTTEAVAKILKTNPRGVLCAPDELTAWLGSFDAYRGGSEKDRSIWVRMFQGGPYTIDRATRGHVAVENLSASILGGIQPERLRQIVAKHGLGDDGLLQRFLTVWGRRTANPVDRKPDEIAAGSWQSLIGNIAEARPCDFGTTRVRLTPDASAVFQSVMDWSADLCALPSTSNHFRGHLSKWGAIYARLLLVVHAAESFDLSGTLLDRVGLDTAERVKKLLFRFFLPHSAALYREIVGSRGSPRHCEWIAGYLLAHAKETVSIRDLLRAYSDLGDDDHAARRAMQALELAGWAVPEDTSNGKPPRHWRINPKAHRVFGERAAAEKRRREAERDKIQAIAARMSALAT